MLAIHGAELASLWASLALLLVVSRLLALVASHLREPPVVGALAAGVLLSPDVLGHAWPAATDWLLPQTQLQGHLLGGIAALSLLFLCFVLGMDTDVRELRALGRGLALVSGSSFLVPLAAGAALGAFVPADFMGAAGSRASLVVLLGAAVAVSSLPVVAWMLREMDMLSTPGGQLALGVSTIQDGLGFVLLAIGIALTGSGSRARLIEVTVGLVVITTLALTVGQRVTDGVLRRADAGPEATSPSLAVMVAAMLAIAAVTQVVHLDGAFGAFLGGVLFGRSTYHRVDAARVIDTLTTAVFAPIYFATAGLDLQLHLLEHRDVAVALVAVVAVGALGKTVGAVAGARLGRLGEEKGMVAAVLNGRGAMQVIIASVALRRSVLSPSAYTVIVGAAITTTLVVAPVVRTISMRSSRRGVRETADPGRLAR